MVFDLSLIHILEAVVQLMVDGRLTSYRVATETNISKMSLATLTKGTSKIKNITYQTALALIDWYDENHEKYGITTVSYTHLWKIQDSSKQVVTVFQQN